MLLSETVTRIRDLARDRPRRSAVLLAALAILAVAALTSSSSSSSSKAPAAASASSASSRSASPSLLAAASPPASRPACTRGAANTAKSASPKSNNNKSATMLGGPTAGDPEESRRAAEFAVAQLQGNNAVAKTGTLSLARIVSAQRQVVAGTNHILVLETKDASGALKTVRATVWEKLPDHARNGQRDLELTKFSVADGGAPAAEGAECADGGVGSGGASSSSWQDAAAKAAVEGINARSNSLVPYELAAVLDAKKASAASGGASELRLRLKRGDKSETFRVSLKEKEVKGGGVGAAAGGSSFGLVSFAHEP